MHIILTSLNLLRQSISQSFELNLLGTKIVQSSELDSKNFQDYIMKKCLNLIKFILADLNDLNELLRYEMQSYFSNIKSINDINISKQIKKIEDLRQKLGDSWGIQVKTSLMSDLRYLLE